MRRNVAVYIAHLNLAAGFRGGERQTQLLLEGLSREGWSQRLVARRNAELAARCAAIRGLDIAAVRADVPAAVRALKGVELVHVHEGRAIQAAWLNRLLRGTPYLVTRRVQRGPGRKWLNRVMYGGAAGLVAVSGAIATSLRGLDPALVADVIPDATSGLAATPAGAAAIRARYLPAGDGLLVGNVSALVDSHKGQMQIIAVARRLRETLPEAVFLLVGTGPDEARLKAAAAGLPNLRFAGFVEEVGDYLAAMDLFFYPSRHEGLGSILLDALEFGLPVVATRVGGIPEIIADPDNGRLCAVDDLEGQTAAVLELLRDRALRARIAATNRARAADYSPARMTWRYIDLYHRLLDRS